MSLRKVQYLVSNTKWALGTFVTWLEERNKLGLSQLDCRILPSNNKQELSRRSRVLRLFLVYIKLSVVCFIRIVFLNYVLSQYLQHDTQNDDTREPV